MSKPYTKRIVSDAHRIISELFDAKLSLVENVDRVDGAICAELLDLPKIHAEGAISNARYRYGVRVCCVVRAILGGMLSAGAETARNIR